MNWRGNLYHIVAARHLDVAISRENGVELSERPSVEGRLVLREISMRFGSFRALDDLSFQVAPGEILGIAGPNGAGKSTVIGVATGHLRPDGGEILMDGRSMLGRPPHRFCKAGVARMFQIPQVFSSMSVRENLEVGAMFGGRERGGSPEGIADILEAVGLASLSERPARDVDLITRKRIMLASALATKPRVLFLDEPLGGLNEDEVQAFSDLILTVRDTFSLSVVLVEHRIKALARLCDRLMIMNFGRLVKVGAPGAILTDPEIVALYLGRPYHA